MVLSPHQMTREREESSDSTAWRAGSGHIGLGPEGTMVKEPNQPGGRTFEHASITATVTKFFLKDYDQRAPREKAADTFLDLLTLPQCEMKGPSFS